MRQWLVDTRYLCTKHLFGEHVEHHMFIGTLKKNRSIKGYIDKGLLNPNTLYRRHEELVQEIKKRGFKHNSNLEVVTLPKIQGKINIENNILDLKNRCTKCNELIQKYSEK